MDDRKGGPLNRTIWIWRIIAILIVLLFAILMWKLYADLTRLKQQRSEGRVPVESAVISEVRGGGWNAGRASRGGLRGAGPGRLIAEGGESIG